MKKSLAYRSSARALLLCLILSVVFPSGTYAMNHLLCASQMEEHHSAENNTHLPDHCVDLSIKFSGHTLKTFDSGQGGFDCECADTQVPDFSDAQITPKVKVFAAFLIPVDEMLLSEKTAAKHLLSEIKPSFSPPPIFLINSTFLN